MSVEDKDILCVLTNVTDGMNVGGFVKAICYREADGSIKPVTADLVPERGEIRVRAGIDQFHTSGIHANCFWLRGIDDDFNYDGERNSARYSCAGRSLTEVKRLTAIEVLDLEIGNREPHEINAVATKFKTTDFVIIRDTRENRYFGPLQVASSSAGGSFYDYESMNLELAAPTGSIYPDPFSELKTSVYASFEIDALAAEQAIFQTSRDERNFLVSEMLPENALTLLDWASKDDLASYFSRGNKVLHKQPSEIASAVEALVDSADMYQDPLAIERIKRVSALHDGYAEMSRSFEDSDVKTFVHDHAEELLARYAAHEREKLRKEKNEAESDLRQIEKQKRDLTKALSDTRDKAALANKQLTKMQTDIAEKLREEEEQKTSRSLALDSFIEEKETLLAQLQTQEADVLQILRQYQGEIAQSKETYVKDMLKHSSIIEALHGRSRGREARQQLMLPDFERGEVDRESLILDVATKAADYFESNGRAFSQLESLALCSSVIRSFVTVFYGDPGSGKTSLAALLLKFFGCAESGTGIEIQVQRGWANTSELIGYENPLSGRREHDRYGFFRMLEGLNDSESLLSDAPALILLDEANLSPVEHYWSDFMNLSDRFFQNPTLVNYPADTESGFKTIKVPSGLRFLATINTDSTTEQLSPRFLSRAAAWRIESSNSEILLTGASDDSTRIGYSTQQLNQAFGVGAQDSFNFENRSALEELQDSLKDLRLLSNRDIIAVIGLARVLEVYLQATNQNSLPALDLALLHCVLPNVRGHGREYKEKLETLKSRFEKKGLSNSAAEVDRILREGTTFNSFFSAV